MREILTIIACVLVALLTAALAGPYFVDWTSQREAIDAQLSRALGATVSTRGAIDLKLLPTPRLVLEGAQAGGSTGEPLFRSGALRLELAVAPLLRGEFHFIEATVESPDLRLEDVGGRLQLPAGVALRRDIRFDRIRIRHGSVTVVRPSAPLTIGGIDLDAEAESLLGPFKGTGTLTRPAGAVTFRFATGAREGNQIRLKFVSDEAVGLPRMDLDGVVTAAGSLASAAFDGNAVFSAAAPLLWRANGPVRIDAGAMTSEGFDLRAGSEDAPLQLTGNGRFDLRTSRADVSLSARQIDFDRFYSAMGNDRERLKALLQSAFEDGSLGSRLSFPLRLDLQVQTLQVGGDTLSEISTTLSTTQDSPPLIRLAASGPGRSSLTLDGTLETGPAARFTGSAEFAARDLTRLADWLEPMWPAGSGRLKNIPFRQIETKGRAVISAGGIVATGLTLRADRSTLQGNITYTAGVGGERARLFADVTSEALDIDGVPDLAAQGRAFSDTDLNLALDARAVRVARFGEGMVDAGRIRLRLQKTQDLLQLEDLSIANLGGASVTMSGEALANSGHVEVRLDAQRLGDLAGLIRRVAPGPFAEALASRATALSPARLTFDLAAERDGVEVPFRLSSLKLDGSVRDTSLSGIVRPDGNGLSLNLSLEAAETPLVLRQIGFETLALSGMGRARFNVTARGDSTKGFETVLDASLAGTDLGFHGMVGGEFATPDLHGALRLKSNDASRLLRILTIALPDITQVLPLDLTADLAGLGRTINAEHVAGRFGATQLSGRLALNREGSPRLEGELELERASVPALFGLLLGPAQDTRPGVLWSSAAFAPGLQAPLPATLSLRAKELRIGDRINGRDASFTLRLADGLLALDALRAHLDQGSLEGDVVLHRDGTAASLSGNLTVVDVPFDRGKVSGVLSAQLHVSSTGQTAAALVAGLAGSGEAKMSSYRFAQADPKAPSRVIVQSDEGQIYVSENDYMGALRRELDKAPLELSDRRFDLNMAGGMLRLTSASGQSLSLDLRTLTFEARANLTADPLPKDWAGSSPQVSVIDRDGTREIDAGAFINALATRAITREAARIEALDGEIRERAAFARRKRGLDFLRLREREIAAFEAEQARLAQEAARKVETEDRRRASEEAARIMNVPAPINIGPLPPASQPEFRAPPANTDPSAAGRY